MTDFTIDEFGSIINEGYNNELDNMETFPEEIRAKIQETYKKLWEEKKKWMEEKEKIQSDK